MYSNYFYVHFYYKMHLENTVAAVRGQVYIHNLFIFSPYRYSSSTLLIRYKIYSDTILPPQNTQKSFDPSLRTKPNYFLPKLTTQNPQQNKLSPHPLSSTLSNYPTSLKPQ